MSGAGAGAHGGLYGDPAADHFAAFDHNDFFFQRSPYAGEGGSSGGGDASITDYLQGLLDPAGLAAHLDAPCRFGDDAVKQEMEAVQLIRHEGLAAGGAPVTPNSSVLSSSSCEAGADEETQRRGKTDRPEEEDEQEENDAEASAAADRNCKRGKAKKGGENKKPREPRVAFMTKSEVDHLEDGYRWRKYGQKAVKNSSYPRSYYRCTAARCGVKKRVERSHQDPSTVVTTYEGQHTHPSPLSLLRPGAAGGVYHGYAAAPPRLGIRTDPRAMIDYVRGTRMAPAGSLLLPQAGGVATPTRLLQEHLQRSSSSHVAAAYGGVLDFIPSAMGGDEHA